MGACFCSFCSYSEFALWTWCGSWSLSDSVFEVDESQTLSVSKKRCDSVTLEHEQRNKAKVDMETTLVQSVAKRTPVKSSSRICKEWSSTSARRSVTATKTRRGLPRCRLRHLNSQERNTRWQIGVDVSQPWQWNARERVLVESMVNHLKTSENFYVGIIDEAISFLSFAENACAGCGRGGDRTLRSLAGTSGEDTEVQDASACKRRNAGFWRPWSASRS